MENLQKFYINGEWVTPQSKNTMPVMNPATEEQIGIVAMGNVDDVNLAVSAANTAFETFSHTSKEERLKLLLKIQEVTKNRFEDLVQAMSLEMGAPMTMARDAQADAAIGHLDGFIEALKKLEGYVTLPNGDVLCKEPIGVCGLITPWNWPINQITLKVLPAIATGCASILKPSEHTPLSAVVYTEILHEAGVPSGVFNLVQGNGEDVGVPMSRHPDIQMMSFYWFNPRRNFSNQRILLPLLKKLRWNLVVNLQI
jgi:aldehyde dehydrogenase (NAD+)